jgi:hypothetical protein
MLLSRAIPDGERPRVQISIAHDHHVRRLHQLGRTDLLAHRLLRLVDVHPEA